jgi:hypothetical protein
LGKDGILPFIGFHLKIDAEREAGLSLPRDRPVLTGWRDVFFIDVLMPIGALDGVHLAPVPQHHLDGCRLGIE